ncbi:MAG: GrpB family protein [Spirochaetota bacterium]
MTGCGTGFFREYLRLYPGEAAKYAMLKKRCAALYKNDREAYTEEKAEYVRALLNVPGRTELSGDTNGSQRRIPLSYGYCVCVQTILGLSGAVFRCMV